MSGPNENERNSSGSGSGSGKVESDLQKLSRIHHYSPQYWDQLPGENPRQFAAFALYRDLGPLRKPGLVQKESGYNRRRLDEIRTKFRWEERVLAYDRELDRIRQAATKLQVHNMAQRQANLGRQMQDIATEKLTEYTTNPDLKALLTPNDVIRLATEGVKIERLAEGETTGEENNQPIVFNIGTGQMPKWAKPTFVIEESKAEGEYVGNGDKVS